MSYAPSAGVRPSCRKVLAGMVVPWVLMACAPFQRSPTDMQRDYARTLRPASPWGGADSAPTGKPARLFRVRVFADSDYRAQHVHWNELIKQQFERASAALGSQAGARLELESVRIWEHASGSSDLHGALAELIALDPARDVDRVVGFVSSIPNFPMLLEQRGLATTPGRHFVVRGSESVEEAAQVRQALNLLSEDEFEELVLAWRVHRETILLLHEWAHTMGAPHDTAEGFVLSPRYNRDTSRFSDGSLALLREALAAVEGSRATPSAQGPDESGRIATSSRPARQSRTDAATLNEVVATFNRTGDVEAAWAIAAPLGTRNPADARIQHWVCYLSDLRRPRASSTLSTCEAAAHLPGTLPEVYLILGHVLIERQERRRALRSLADAEAGLLKQPDEASWAYLAHLYARAGDCSDAQRAAAKVPGAPQAHQVAEVCAPREARRQAVP